MNYEYWVANQTDQLEVPRGCRTNHTPSALSQSLAYNRPIQTPSPMRVVKGSILEDIFKRHHINYTYHESKRE